jgi:hypothetical protein
MAEPTPTKTETVTSNIPEWAKQFATDILGFGASLTYPKQKLDPKTGQPVFQTNPVTGQQVLDSKGQPIPVLESGFQPYARELVAGESPLQQQAIGDLSRMQVAPQIGQATGFTGLAALQAQNLAQYDPLQQRNFYRSPFEPSRRPGAPAPLQQYMSPYMQNVVEEQKRQAIQDYSRQIPGMQAAATRAGARGGTREALLQSEARRNLGEQLGTIQATGLQNAYQQAAAQAAQDAQLRAQFGLSGAQLGEQSRQFGAGLGMQGLQQQLAAAGQLGQLGQQQYQQASGILGAQMGAGAQQQALKQRMLETDYQRFIDEMTYPYKQLEFMSNLIRGIPSTDSTTRVYSAPPSTLGMLTGVTGGLGGLFGSLGR